jgi:hypothetical protein
VVPVGGDVDLVKGAAEEFGSDWEMMMSAEDSIEV